MRDLKRVNFQPSPNLKVPGWLDRRFVFRGHSYPVKNLLAIGLVFLLLLFLGVYLLIAHRSAEVSPDVAIQKETKQLTNRIGKFMELPVGEQPTLATVTDKEKLKGQDFFANAQNGDKLLVYPNAKKAILYRPSTGKIIEVTNLISGDGGQSQQPVDINSNLENLEERQ